MTGTQPTEDRLLMDMIKTNRRTDGETMTKKQYEKHGDYNPWQAVNRFGSWRKARARAGIYKDSHDKKRYSDKEILEDLAQVIEETDSKTTVQDYREHGSFSISNIYNRFDSFTSARTKADQLR